ncbi:MAG: hypothetical protein ACFFF4_15230, partial [Candidatus Thorarchaeota archaeon]
MANYPKESVTRPSKRTQIFPSYRDIVVKGIIPLAVLLLLWQLIAMISTQSRIGLDGVAASFVELIIEGDADGQTLLVHTSMSLYRVAIGFIVAFLTAVPLGIA